MANVTDKNALPVLIEWAVINGHDAPVFNALDNSISIAGVDDAQIQAVLDSATVASIADANTHSTIRAVQTAFPKPKNATLEQSKEWALMIAAKVISQLRTLSTGGADASQLTGWVDKLAAAEKIAAGTASAAEIAIIQAEADMRNLSESASVLADKIIIKGNALRTVRSKIDGFEDKLKRNIAAISDVPGFNAAMDALVNDGAIIINSLGA
jgi:ribosomal silencing factor RsfS